MFADRASIATVVFDSIRGSIYKHNYRYAVLAFLYRCSLSGENVLDLISLISYRQRNQTGRRRGEGVFEGN